MDHRYHATIGVFHEGSGQLMEHVVGKYFDHRVSALRWVLTVTKELGRPHFGYSIRRV